MDGEPRGPPPDPLLGRLLLHYRVLEVIGQGGMSVVYRGRDEHLARDVAIKVLHPFLREKQECRMRLAREARAVARLEHPHIVKVFDFSGDRPTLNEKRGEDEEKENARAFPSEGFIVAELVKGPTLKRHAEKCSLWRVPEAGALVVWQLALALQHAHDNGVIHRDLKPENVMVRDDGVLKLMDFGIAQVRDQSGLTITGTLLGSPAHMAPECIDGHPADERSDIFSLGTVLYWATTGSLPFEALTPHALLKLIVDGKATPAQQKSPRVSDDLARVIARALATKPQDRFASAKEFATALEEVLEKSGVPADSVLLRRLLAEPSVELPRQGARVRSAFLERAQKSLDEGATARAMSALNRVLPDDPADKDARALLDRLDADDVDEIEAQKKAEEERKKAQEEQKQKLHAAIDDLSPVERTDPSRTLPPEVTHPSLTSPQNWQRVGVGVAAIAMVVSAVVIANKFDDVRQPLPPPPPPTKLVEAPVEEGTSRGSPAAFEVRDDDKDEPKKKKQPREPRLQLPLAPVEPKKEEETKKQEAVASAPSSSKRPVTFKLNSWADIFVDDVLVAKQSMGATVDVEVGERRVSYRNNPAAKDRNDKLIVPAGTAALPVTIKLEPRPALLEVRASQADAFVSVDGGPVVTASDTRERPMLVPLDGSRAQLEVYVYKKGYAAYRKRVLFQAGDRLQLDVVLEPEPLDAPAPPPKDPG